MKRPFAVVPAVLLVLAFLGTPAQALTLGGRSSTQAFFFSDERSTDHFALAEYLRATARNFDAGDTLAITGYGRASGDVQEGGGVDGRLYYLYADKRNLPGNTAIRAGRQFFYVSAGSSVIDGARIDTNPLGPVALTLAGGRNVRFDAEREISHSGDVAAAAQLSLVNVETTSADVSYAVTYDESDLARELVGLQANHRFAGLGELYTQLRFDVLSEVWNEVLGGARVTVVPRLTLTGEYFRYVPVFDATSIYAVFASDRYQEILLKADYSVSRRMDLEGAYRNESYTGGDTANVGEAGVRLRPTDASSVYAGGIWRNGTGGGELGFEVSADMTFLRSYILAAGVQMDRFNRNPETGKDTVGRFWLGGNARFGERFSASARLEDVLGEDYDRDLRLRLALNLDF